MRKTIGYIFCITLIINTSCKKSEFKDRVISDYHLSIKNSFEYEDGIIVRMWADDSLIYLSSSPDNSMRVHDYQGVLKKTLGKKGGAPWENGTIWNFTRDSIFYWVHDYPKMALKKYYYEEDTMVITKRLITKHNIQPVGSNRAIVPRLDEKTVSFYLSLYDALQDTFIRDVDLCRLTGRFDKLPPFADYTFQGDFCRNNAGKVIFYCMYNSSFFVMNERLDSIKYYTDIRNLPIAEPIVTQHAIKLEPWNVGIPAACADNNYLYCLTPRYNVKYIDDTDEYLLDVYNLNTGEYIKSFNVPNNDDYIPIKIAITKQGFIVSYDNGMVVIYENFTNEI